MPLAGSQSQKALKYGWSSKPTIGLLLVKSKNKTVVEYSLAGYTNPIRVADWQEQLTKELPEELKSSLPTIEEIEKEMDDSNFATTITKLDETNDNV